MPLAEHATLEESGVRCGAPLELLLPPGVDVPAAVVQEEEREVDGKDDAPDTFHSFKEWARGKGYEGLEDLLAAHRDMMIPSSGFLTVSEPCTEHTIQETSPSPGHASGPRVIHIG